jgi:hypothetical protein
MRMRMQRRAKDRWKSEIQSRFCSHAVLKRMAAVELRGAIAAMFVHHEPYTS